MFPGDRILTPKSRARELLAQGFTGTRTFRRLRKEFPGAEHFDLKVAAGLGPTGITPNWSERSGFGRSVVIRNDPRKFDQEPKKGAK